MAFQEEAEGPGRRATLRQRLEDSHRWASVRGLGLLIVLGLALAGCASPPSSNGNAALALDDRVVAGPAGPAAPSAPAWTDTLHLRVAPALNATAPENESVIATKGAYFPDAFAWNMTAPLAGNVSGADLVVWLQLPHSAVQQGVGGDPGCTLHWSLSATTNGTATAADGGCISLGFGPLQPGLYRLEGHAPPWLGNLTVAHGTNVAVQLQLGIVLPNGGAAYLLSGPEHDSWLRLHGLRVPLPRPGPTATL